jgi:Phage tail sheath C-terminal domain
MAINFTISDNPIILPATAGGSKIAGCYSRSGLHLLGTTSELNQGYITESTGQAWYDRVRKLSRLASGVTIGNTNYTTIIDNGATGGSGGAIQLLRTKNNGFVLASLAGSSGATTTIPSGFQDQWWSVYNYLQYGNSVKIAIQNGVGFTGQLGPNGITGKVSPFPVTSPTGTGAFGFYGTGALDVMFQISHGNGTTLGWSGETYTMPEAVSDVINLTQVLLSSETPTVCIVNAGLTGSYDAAPSDVGLPTLVDNHTFLIAGRKLHFGLQNDSTLPILTTHLAPDVAGMCLVGDYWQSPAGTVRGKVQNVISLETNISPPQTTVLDEKHVNYCKTVNGVGTILLADDIAGASEWDIRVTRTVDHVKIDILPFAYDALFEINNEVTRSIFVNAAAIVLNDLVVNGAISNYETKCNTENNTPATIAAGQFIAEIKIYFGTIIREIILSVTRGIKTGPI